MDENNRGKIFICLVLAVFIFLALLAFPTISERPISIIDEKISNQPEDVSVVGLVAYYPLDIDSSDYFNNSGIVIGNAKYFKKGKVDGAFNFDGKGDYIYSSKSAPEINNGEISISLWIKPLTFEFTSSTSKAYSTILSKSNLTNPSQMEYRFRFYNSSNTNNRSNAITFAVANSIGGSNAIALTNYNSSEDKWIHLVGTLNKSNLLLYKNAELVSYVNLPENFKAFSTKDSLLIGTSDLTDFFPGSIDEIRIYNHTISHLEVYSLYKEKSKNITCYSNSDCGTLVSVNYCLFSHLCTNKIAFSCDNPGKVNSQCSTGSDVECSLCLKGCFEGSCIAPEN